MLQFSVAVVKCSASKRKSEGGCLTALTVDKLKYYVNNTTLLLYEQHLATYITSANLEILKISFLAQAVY